MSNLLNELFVNVAIALGCFVLVVFIYSQAAVLQAFATTILAGILLALGVILLIMTGVNVFTYYLIRSHNEYDDDWGE